MDLIDRIRAIEERVAALERRGFGYPTPTSLSFWNSEGCSFFCSKDNPHIAKNAYWDGNSWYRWNESAGAVMFQGGGDGEFKVFTVGPGSGAISWSEKFRVENNGDVNLLQNTLYLKKVSGSYYGMGMDLYGTTGIVIFSDDKISFAESDAETIRAVWSMNNATFDFYGTVSVNYLKLQKVDSNLEGGEMRLYKSQSSYKDWIIDVYTDRLRLWTPEDSSRLWYFDYGDKSFVVPASSIFRASGRMHIDGTEICYLLNDSGVRVSKAWGGTGNLTVEGNLTVSGSKNFSIPHPLKEGKRLVHSALEGPESAVFYRGEAKLEDGVAVISLPDYFEALTKKEGRTVLLTCKNGWSPLYVDGEVEDGKFVVRTTENGNPSQEFYWEVKAVRADVDFQVEVDDESQDDVINAGIEILENKLKRISELKQLLNKQLKSKEKELVEEEIEKSKQEAEIMVKRLERSPVLKGEHLDKVEALKSQLVKSV